MSFDPWQIDKIRARLMSYTEDKGRPPNLLPLATVRERMRECPAVDDSLFDPEGNRQFRYEALRRFYQGTEDPLDFKIEAVRDFLIFEGFLSKEELTDEGGDFGELLALHGYLANTTQRARLRTELLADGRYIQASPVLSHDPHIELHVTRDMSRVMMRIEERVLYPEPEREGHVFPEPKPSKTIRKGFGFFSTKNCLLHVFLRGRTGQDRIHYIEFIASYTQTDPYLIRVGGTNETTLRGLETFQDHGALPYFGIRRFRHEAFEVSPKPSDERHFAPSVPEMPQTHREIFQSQHAQQPNDGRSWQTFAVPKLDIVTQIEEDSPGMLQTLLTWGDDPNVQDEEGMTALHHAAGLGNRACIRALVGAGTCDYLVRDNYGRYASDLAIEWARDYGMARLLSKKRRQQAFARGVAAYVAR